jgi:surfactin synthase thioesterase subunit
MASQPEPATVSRRWLLRSIPEDATAVLACFPYSGVGASSYRDWPRTVAGMTVVPLQPPGRENRLREPKPTTHREFARSLVDALALLGKLPFGFFGHCGAVPYMLETVIELSEHDSRQPSWIVASSWGAPHRGLYGALNFVDLQTHDFAAEVVGLAAKLGRSMPSELVEMAADLLRFDQTIQRGYRYPADAWVPVPVAALGWSHDDIVPAATATTGWQEVADVRTYVLNGNHGAYLGCPPELQELFAVVRATWPDALTSA